MNYKKFGANIRKKRHLEGLTLEKLSERVHVGDNFLGKVERAESIPSLETTVEIANALGCGVDVFLHDNLISVTSYISEDIERLTKEMDPETRKDFMEFVRINAEFFLEKSRNVW